MIFAHYPFDYLNIQRITTLANNLTAALLYLALQYLITIFGYPYKVNLYAIYAVGTVSVFHLPFSRKGKKRFIKTKVLH
jgi:hypothetical protein